MGRFSFLRDDAVVSFLKIVGWLLVPVLIYMLGLVLLTSELTAFLWLAIIAGIVLGFVRFYAKHNEHIEFDDHLPSEVSVKGLQTYLHLLGKDEKRDKDPA